MSQLTAAARSRGYGLTAGVLLVLMVGGTLPVALYILYQKQMGFGALGVTVVFAAYVAGTLAALIFLGDLSDHIGRRKVLTLAVACAAVSTALFLVATSIGVLIIARVVSGLAAGFVTGTATAALAELQPRNDRRAAAVVASGSNLTGLGLGPLVAGLFAEYVALPTQSVFWAYLGACALVLAAIRGIPETVRQADHKVSLRPRLAAPAGMRGVIIGACLGAFAAFSVLGLYSSLVPTFVHSILGIHNLALIGGGSFLIFVVAAVSQAASSRLPARRSVSAGLPLLLVCLAGLELAVFSGWLWAFVVSAVVGGVAVGFIFRGGLSELSRLADDRHRAAVVSTFFAVAYLGLGVTPVLTGLISVPVGATDASAIVAGLAAAIVLAAIIAVLRAFGLPQRGQPGPADRAGSHQQSAGTGDSCCETARQEAHR